MNLLESAELRAKLAHRIRVIVRHLDPFRKVHAFSTQTSQDSIGRIYAINLDRKPERWKFVRRELGRFRSKENQPLTAITRRFSAIDARYLPESPRTDLLIPTFTLAEQLAIHPDPLLVIDDNARERTISMTKPEVAIALSHIKVWKLIARGDAEFVMVLEDDVMMRPGFTRRLNKEWPALQAEKAELVYLSFRDVSGVASNHRKSVHRQERPGLWEASAYVLSRGAARKLLGALPANGPIDLWMNFQFEKLRTFTTSIQLIEQRLAEPSTNSYSILPILSQVGSVTREKVPVVKDRRMPGPVLAIGAEGSGLTALAVALSTLGYCVASDLAVLPEKELADLRAGKRGTSFDAFVNVGSVDEALIARVMKSKSALLIITDGRDTPLAIPDHRILHMPSEIADKWDHLSKFLKIDYPSHPYPSDLDLGQRFSVQAPATSADYPHVDLKRDRSPWIMAPGRLQDGLVLGSTPSSRVEQVSWHRGDELAEHLWFKRQDTFPSNLAIFHPLNVSSGGAVNLTLRSEKSLVRDFTSGAIAAREPFLYGSFGASLRPARGSGIVTGLFLHRNGPRQEIDIEFLGKDTTKMLVNVFYNPGAEGTKLEHGYRGTPTEISLGFDAAEEFHHYEIEWRPEVIRWKVDGTVVYQRNLWNPTPIPNRPLEFNINIWASRSVEFAGRLDVEALPRTSSLNEIAIRD
ncbi:hypothetical protein ALI44B_05940 [Leifsonia sp. ALI-44-B]|uniref:family 16 glycosylhydrolase n=1 Tax=Leifsonia sp. ALI-44-B TaxID=1933776 RepID=UPI00097CB546|nr:family 16 glycosylhydrolase [Leifsonia sp. ALI-44-B]ONI64113.1 hypothetical protein ALI44B_05940 [Leifsonia sp. ALI-44-B]